MASLPSPPPHDPAAPLLFVGFQRGVLPALRALQRPAVALVPSDTEPPSADGIETRPVDLHGPLEPVSAAADELLGGRRPAAVIALAERTVFSAARLRAAYGLPGDGPDTALRCADKVEMKRAMEAAGVPVARWREVDSRTNAEELVEALGLPLVLKPRRDSGGRGQRKLEDIAAVRAALERLTLSGAFERSYGWLGEGWIEGVEMSVETFVADGRPLLHNPTEYYVPRHANILPAALDAGTWCDLRAFVARAIAAVGVTRGITHVELFRTSTGPVFGELAARPPGGRLMTLIRRAWGFDPWLALLQLGMGEAPALPDAARRTAGVWILHPGPGRVRNITGLDAARATEHVRRITLKTEVGATITPRSGSGQDVGAIYAEGPDRTAVASALTQARERLVFELT